MMLSSSYAAATAPHQTVTGWEDDCVVWETSRPYTYLRRTSDARVVIGGRDKPFRNTFLRDLLLPIEHALLGKKLRQMLNDRSIRLPLRWTGTFAESSDGMPLIGERPEWPGVLFVFGCGGNGTTFGAVARDLIPDWLNSNPNPALRLFAINRDSLTNPPSGQSS